MNDIEQTWKPSGLRKRRIAQEIQRLDDLKAKRKPVVDVRLNRTTQSQASLTSRFTKMLFACGVAPKRLRAVFRTKHVKRDRNFLGSPAVVNHLIVPVDAFSHVLRQYEADTHRVHVGNGPGPRREEIQRVRRMLAGSR